MDANTESTTERHIATIGALNLACGLSMAVFSALTLLALVGATHPDLRTYLALVAVFFALLGGVNGILWLGLRARSPSARVVQILVGVAALPGLPLGTLWGGYVLWVLLRAPGKAAFASPRPANAPRVEPFRGIVALGVTVALAVVVGGLFTSRDLWDEARMSPGAAPGVHDFDTTRRIEPGYPVD